MNASDKINFIECEGVIEADEEGFRFSETTSNMPSLRLTSAPLGKNPEDRELKLARRIGQHVSFTCQDISDGWAWRVRHLRSHGDHRPNLVTAQPPPHLRPREIPSVEVEALVKTGDWLTTDDLDEALSAAFDHAFAGVKDVVEDNQSLKSAYISQCVETHQATIEIFTELLENYDIKQPPLNRPLVELCTAPGRLFLLKRAARDILLVSLKTLPLIPLISALAVSSFVTNCCASGPIAANVIELILKAKSWSVTSTDLDQFRVFETVARLIKLSHSAEESGYFRENPTFEDIAKTLADHYDYDRLKTTLSELKTAEALTEKQGRWGIAF